MTPSYKNVTLGHWNYRLLRWPGEDEEDTVLMVHEVFYDENGKPMFYSENGASVVGDGIDDVKDTLEQIATAIGLPILSIEDFTMPSAAIN